MAPKKYPSSRSNFSPQTEHRVAILGSPHRMDRGKILPERHRGHSCRKIPVRTDGRTFAWVKPAKFKPRMAAVAIACSIVGTRYSHRENFRQELLANSSNSQSCISGGLGVC